MSGRRSVSGTVAGLAVVIVILAALAGYFGYAYSTKKVTTVTTTITSPTTVTTTVTVYTTATSLVTTTTTAVTTTTTTTAVTTTSVPTPVTITVADTYSTSENAAFNQTLMQFEEAYPWIHVDVEYGASVGTSPYTSEAQSGTAPNVIRDSGDAAAALFAAGIALNLTPYLPGGASYMKQFNSIAAEEWMANSSTVFGLPDDLTYIVMFYNKKFITAPPNTTDQLVQIAEQVNKSGVWGIAYGVGDDWGYRFAAWFYGYGGQIFTTVNGKLFPDLNSSAMVNALEFWYNLTYNLRVNYLAPSSGAGGVEGQLFMANKTAIIFDGPWDFGSYYSALGCDLGVWTLPQVSATGLYASPMATSMGWLVTTPQASGATPEQIKASVLFVEYMTNYTAQLRLFDYAHDVVANTGALSAAISMIQYNTSCVAQDFKMILEQANHVGVAPSVPQMAYYWPSFHQYATEYFAQKITAQQAAQGMESYFIQQLQQNGLLSPATPSPGLVAAPEESSRLF